MNTLLAIDTTSHQGFDPELMDPTMAAVLLVIKEDKAFENHIPLANRILEELACTLDQVEYTKFKDRIRKQLNNMEEYDLNELIGIAAQKNLRSLKKPLKKLLKSSHTNRLYLFKNLTSLKKTPPSSKKMLIASRNLYKDFDKALYQVSAESPFLYQIDRTAFSSRIQQITGLRIIKMKKLQRFKNLISERLNVMIRLRPSFQPIEQQSIIKILSFQVKKFFPVERMAPVNQVLEDPIPLPAYFLDEKRLNASIFNGFDPSPFLRPLQEPDPSGFLNPN